MMVRKGKRPVFNYAPGSDRLSQHTINQCSLYGYETETWVNQGYAEAWPTYKIKITTTGDKRLFKFSSEKEADNFMDYFDKTIHDILSGR